jgi:phosphohistidine swiveling domain-containing protein
MLLSDVTLFKTLDTLDASDQPRIGGKAYNCARLKQAGFPVPDGLVVPTDALDAQIRAIPAESWFDSLPADTVFAIRSSGVGEDSDGHSFAGIHETQLNVHRDRIVNAVMRCRESAQSEQARAYREARHLSADDLAIGVLVQRMVPALISGVAFTVNPTTGADELVINAAPGLGEALVSGRVTPDEYRLRKSDFGIISSRRVRDTSDPLDLVVLGRLLLRTERYYGAAQDVEWCHDGAQFWIVQSRPVTSAHRVPQPALRAPHSAGHSGASAEVALHSAISDQQRALAVPDPEWTRANLAEVLPDQLSPQSVAAYTEMLNRGQRKFMGRLLAPDSELGPMFGAFHGRLYMNLSQMRRVASILRAPAANVLRSLGHSEAIQPDDEVVKPSSLGVLLRCLPDLIRTASYDARAETLLRRHEKQTREAIGRITATDPRTMSDGDIWKMIQWWIDIGPDAIQIVFIMSGVLFRETAIRKACVAVGFPYERLVYPQLAAGERSVSSQQAFDLVALADSARREPAAVNYLLANDGTFADYRQRLEGTAFLERFDRFLDEYGHRGRYESDWSLPRMHENPAPALFAIRERLHGAPQDLQAIAARQEAEAAAAWREFEARLSWWQRLTLLPLTRAYMRRLKKQYVWREQVRSDLTRVLRYAREYHLTLATRFVERGWIDRRDDYFLLELGEVGEAIGNPRQDPGLRDIAGRRRAQLLAERDLAMPLLMHESELPSLLARSRETKIDGTALTGLCVSPGLVEADVVVMRDPSEFASMKRGAILVATATDPSWTPLFTLASGVIVEVGGMLSHASTIAREYGLPALANVKDATRLLKTGDRIMLDASGGRAVRVEMNVQSALRISTGSSRVALRAGT